MIKCNKPKIAIESEDYIWPIKYCSAETTFWTSMKRLDKIDGRFR